MLVDWREEQLAQNDEGLTVRVLGPFEVTGDGQPVALSSGRQRTLLAVLALSAGRPVSVDRLATALWGEDLPDNARRSVQTYLTRLRSAIGTAMIETSASGYRLLADPDRVDALRFIRLLDDAAVPTDPATQRARLVETLGMWRGTPFDGVQSDWLERTQAPRLTERYLAAVERRIDLDLASGHHHNLVAELYELTARHRLRESLWVRLLLALDRSGRQAEALERYETIRVSLAEELGTDPGPELRQVHADLLAGRPASQTPPAQPVVPRQLPADIDGFTGREAALKALDNLISEDGQTSHAVVISAIAGTAGVGKTALALHWAHRVADRFPDGQLYVNLRGFHPSPQAMTPAEAIRGFLDALDLPPERVPSDLDAQAGLYRSLLAGKRMLILLDNARDTDQVLPLLPGSPGSLVIVTSRNQLTSLVATKAARPVVLDLLTIDDARTLLTRRLGADRVAAEPEAADEIITRCARLPLALAIAAARAATHPTFALHALAAQLHEERSRLDTLAAGDPATDARAVFSWSYQTLSSEAARLFRLLGLHPGPDTSLLAAASLAGRPVAAARSLLAELTRAHLLTETTSGRYLSHDLLRSYTSELTRGLDTQPDRHTALGRLLDHYLHTAHPAAKLLNPPHEPTEPAPAGQGVTAEPLADRKQALAWFTTEHPALVAAIQRAASAGFDSHVWRLAWCMAGYLDRQGHWRDLAATQRAALAAAQRLGDRSNSARAHRYLAVAHSWFGDYQDTHTHLQHALEIYEDLDDLVGQGLTHQTLSVMLEEQADHRAALRHAYRSLELYRQIGDQTGQARALNAVGWLHALLREYQPALTHCQQALELLKAQGDRHSQAHTLDSIGFAYHHLGHHRQAIASYQRSIELLHEVGDRYYLAQALVHRGDARDAAGQLEQACVDWRAALEILDTLGHADAHGVRAKLEQLDHRARSQD